MNALRRCAVPAACVSRWSGVTAPGPRAAWVRCLAASASEPVRLNTLKPAPGSKSARKRVGRGIGSGLGKTAGRGHKGQKSRSGGRAPVPGFEGGQTPLHKVLPKIGFRAPRSAHEALEPLNVGKVQAWLDMGRLDGGEADLLTMRDFAAAGLVSKRVRGVKLLGDGALTTKVHLEVSRASAAAIAAVESAGGTVTCAHYNRLALRALRKPEKFAEKASLPRRARPPPRLMRYYADDALRGEYSPLVQRRNRALGLAKRGPSADTAL